MALVLSADFFACDRQYAADYLVHVAALLSSELVGAKANASRHQTGIFIFTQSPRVRS